MKRTALLLFLLMLAAVPAKAGIYIDTSGGFIMAGDARNQVGGGLNILTDFLNEYRDWNLQLCLRNSFSYARVNANQPNEYVYNSMSWLAGAQFQYNLYSMPLYWISTAGLGGAMLMRNQAVAYGPFSDPSQSEMVSDYGFSLGLWTGVLYHMTQDFGAFLEVGYQQTFLTGEFKKMNVGGLQVLLGIRYALIGGNKSLWEE